MNAVKALKLGLRMGRETGKPVDLFTQADGMPKESFEEILEDRGMDEEVSRRVRNWHFFETGSFEHNLYNVPHNALTVMGCLWPWSGAGHAVWQHHGDHTDALTKYHAHCRTQLRDASIVKPGACGGNHRWAPGAMHIHMHIRRCCLVG